MPWQQQVADVGLELDPTTGRPAYRSVVFTVPRQSGKSTLILAWEIQRAIGWDEPQRIAYSAQTGNDARKKLLEDQVPLLERHRRRLAIRRILKGMGNESIEFMNGSRIILLASSEESGHGKTIDLGVKDELFADSDFRRDQALVPAMATRPFAQVVTASTAGTESSVALNREIEAGRAAVEADLRSGIAYFEWSAEPDCDPDDENEWQRCMPALGHTIDLSVVRHARRTLDVSEFKRAFLNIPTTHIEGPVIDGNTWELINDAKASPSGRLAIGIDAAPGQSHGAIAVSGEGVVELVEHRISTTWLVPRLLEMRDRHIDLRSAVVAIDPSGPAGFIVPALEEARFEVRQVAGREMGQACAHFYSSASEKRILVRRHPDLTSAISGARTASRGDVWVWSRKDGTVDISPLVAATLAHWAADLPAEKVPLYIY